MFALALLAGLAALGAPGEATAQQSAALGPEGVWTSDCSIDRMTDRKRCRVTTYRRLGEGAAARVVGMSVVPMDKDYTLVLSTDRGIVEECAFRVDRKPRIESYMATFNTCMFPYFMGGKLVDTFRGGTSVLVRLVMKDGSQQDIDFSLKGFPQAFDDMARSLQ